MRESATVRAFEVEDDVVPPLHYDAHALAVGVERPHALLLNAKNSKL